MNQLLISKLAVDCRKFIEQSLLCLFNGRLVYLEHVTVSTNHIFCIVVPIYLRFTILNLMESSLVSVHIGECKTLYYFKVRFFWYRKIEYNKKRVK